MSHQLIWIRDEPLGRWKCLPIGFDFEEAFPTLIVLAEVNDPPIEDWSFKEVNRPIPEESEWCVKDGTLFLRLSADIWTDGMNAIRLEDPELFLTQAEAIEKIESAIAVNDNRCGGL